MNSLHSTFALILLASLTACDQRIKTPSDFGQEVGDVLNPDGRRRETEVAREASAAAAAATETARQANELAQANLRAAAVAKAEAEAEAEAERMLLGAKQEAARAAAELSAREAVAAPQNTSAGTAIPK